MFMSRKGLTLLEIIVATAILALVIAGLANIFIAGKRYILHSRTKMTGGELGRYFLDEMQMQVREDTWSSSCLGQGGASCPDHSEYWWCSLP